MAIGKVRESQAQQQNTTVISALDESQRSKSVMMLPSEQSISKAPPEIEDIIREAQKEETTNTKHEGEAKKPEEQLKKKEEEKKKESEDEYEKDDFDAEFD